MKLLIAYGMLFILHLYVPLYGMHDQGAPLLIDDDGYETFTFHQVLSNAEQKLEVLHKLSLNESMDELDQEVLNSLLDRQETIVTPDLGYLRRKLGIRLGQSSAFNSVLFGCNSVFLAALLYTFFECNTSICNETTFQIVGYTGMPLLATNLISTGFSAWLARSIRPSIQKEIVQQENIIRILQSLDINKQDD